MSNELISKLELVKLKYQKDKVRNTNGPVYVIFEKSTGVRKQIINEKELYKFLNRTEYVIEIGNKSSIIAEYARKIDQLAIAG